MRNERTRLRCFWVTYVSCLLATRQSRQTAPVIYQLEDKFAQMEHSSFLLKLKITARQCQCCILSPPFCHFCKVSTLNELKITPWPESIINLLNTTRRKMCRLRNYLLSVQTCCQNTFLSWLWKTRKLILMCDQSV